MTVVIYLQEQIVVFSDQMIMVPPGTRKPMALPQDKLFPLLLIPKVKYSLEQAQFLEMVFTVQ